MGKKTFDSIVAALGGTAATARVIGKRPSQVCQYRSRHGQFPAEVYFLLRDALEAQGIPMPRDACRFDDGRKAG